MTAERARSTAGADQIARVWEARDLRQFANPGVYSIPVGTPTDWGLAAAAEAPFPPVSLGGGIPDPDTLPRRELIEAMQQALAVEDDGPLRYGGAIGYEPLRVALAERYTRDRGLRVGADSFMLTNGSAGAIESICAAMLQHGDAVITEVPTFSGSLRTFRGRGAEIIPVGMDEHGMRTDELEQTLDRLAAAGRRVKLIYTIANYHNPMGVSMTLERRMELLRIAARHSALVLDDDAYGELYFDTPPPPSLSVLAGGHGVITVGSFSKVIATGIRVGWIHARPELIEMIARMRFDMGNSPLLHYMLHRFMQNGRLDEHVAMMRGVYREKMHTLADALVEYAEPYIQFARPAGGFFLWVRVREGLSAAAVQRAGVEEAVVFPLGAAFFPDGRDRDGEHIRLAFSWTSNEDLRIGAERLALACARVAGDR